jgi:hypothetical protein
MPQVATNRKQENFGEFYSYVIIEAGSIVSVIIAVESRRWGDCCVKALLLFWKMSTAWNKSCR